MEFEWDDAKYQRNLAKHHPDFADAWELWEGPHFEWLDTRHEYGEVRQVVIGLIFDRACVCVYTIRDGRHRIISLRRANSREQARYWQAVDDQLGTRG